MAIQINLSEPESIQLDRFAEAVQEWNRIRVADGMPPAVLVSKDDVLCAPTDDGRLIDVTQDSLAGIMRAYAEPGQFKTNKDDPSTPVWTPVSKLPRDLMRMYIDTHRWTGVPRVRQIARAPIVRKDFSIRWEAGWDEISSCWVTKGIEKDTSLLDRPAVGVPGEEGYFEGGLDVRNVFGKFPLIDDRLLADCVAAALTPLLSTAVDGPLPAMIVSARKVGSGKTELAKFCSMLGNGGKTFTTWRGANEMDKMIQTYVAEDNRVVIFDNIKGDIDSQSLESVITTRTISYRQMREHKSKLLRSNTAWFMTGNGAIVSEDMVRRSIVMMLDKDSFPKGWTDAMPRYVEDHEAALITGMCALIENWKSAGMPRGSVYFSNFEEWSTVVSGILEVAGIEGMWEARDLVIGEAIQSDDEDEMPVVEAIAWMMGDTEWGATELWEKANDFSGVLDPKTLYVKEWLQASSKTGASAKKPSIPTGRALHKILGKSFPGTPIQLHVRVKDGRKLYWCATSDGSELKTAPASEGGVTATF